MLIVCPSCASQYDLDAAKLGPDGRKVRCASCRTSWHVDRREPAFPEAPSAEETQALLNEELEQAALIDAQVTALAAERGEAAEARQRRTRRRRASAHPGLKARGAATKPMAARRGGLFAPAALTLAGVVLAGTLVWQRELAVRAAPQLAVLFDRIGMPVNLRGPEAERRRERCRRGRSGPFPRRRGRRHQHHRGKRQCAADRGRGEGCRRPDPLHLDDRAAARRIWSRPNSCASGRGSPRRRRTGSRCWCASPRPGRPISPASADRAACPSAHTRRTEHGGNRFFAEAML